MKTDIIKSIRDDFIESGLIKNHRTMSSDKLMKYSINKLKTGRHRVLLRDPSTNKMRYFCTVETRLEAQELVQKAIRKMDARKRYMMKKANRVKKSDETISKYFGGYKEAVNAV